MLFIQMKRNEKCVYNKMKHIQYFAVVADVKLLTFHFYYSFMLNMYFIYYHTISKIARSVAMLYATVDNFFLSN